MIRRYAASTLAALVAALTLTACAGAGTGDLTPSDGGPPSPSGNVIEIEATEFAFTPNTFTAQVGQAIAFEVTNNGALEHNFVVLDASGMELARTTIAVGGTESVEVMLAEAGAYTIVCDIEGHRESGMQASLTVQSAATQ